jgi:hypothetical protein
MDECRPGVAAVDLARSVADQVRSFAPSMLSISSPNSLASAFPASHTSAVRQIHALEASLEARMGPVADVLALGRWTK